MTLVYRHFLFINRSPRMKQGLRRFTSQAFLKSAVKAYVQGQTADHNLREYFYYIDHNGMLFLDDAKMKNFTSCFKEKKFLEFFYKQLRVNKTGRHEETFPYISPCGREMNYIRCDDRPIVYTGIFTNETGDRLAYGYAGQGPSVTFQPEELCMLPQSGRVYHPADEKYGGIGLIKSSLSIDFSKYFKFGQGDTSPPTEFVWKSKNYVLTNSLYNKIHK